MHAASRGAWRWLRWPRSRCAASRRRAAARRLVFLAGYLVKGAGLLSDEMDAANYLLQAAYHTRHPTLLQERLYGVDFPDARWRKNSTMGRDAPDGRRETIKKAVAEEHYVRSLMRKHAGNLERQHEKTATAAADRLFDQGEARAAAASAASHGAARGPREQAAGEPAYRQSRSCVVWL